MPNTATKPQLVMERTYKATPEQVWAAWTDRRALEQWFAPGPMGVRVRRLDLRVGGAYEIDMVGPETVTCHGTYTEVAPGRRLAFTWTWKGQEADLDTLCTLELARVPGGTRLTFTHSGFPGAEALARHQEGWEGCFAKLDAVLA
jgi:uncharacterized protein YndB with AHSA1/START domain